MQPENDNLKDFKIALGRQVTDLHKRHEGESATLREKIKTLEKSRAYLQARSSIETAKINRAYRARLAELESREKNTAQREYALVEREKKIDRELAEKDSIIQKLNLRTVEIESDLMSEFNQKFRAEKHELQRREDEIEVLKKNLASACEDFEKQAESLRFEIRALNERRKEEHLSMSSQFAVERGEFEREKFTMQQNIKALKNTVNALKDAHRQTVSEYEDRLKAETLRASEGRSSLANSLEEANMERESLRRKLEELRLSSRNRDEESAKKYAHLRHELKSEIQSKEAEIAALAKSGAELKKINEDQKDSHNGKIDQLESVARSMEIELRNSLSAASSENERLAAALRQGSAEFAEKEAELKEENSLLAKELTGEREKSRDSENKSSARYLTLADEKKHMQEMLEREISSLKEKLLQRQQAMAAVEAAASRSAAELHIRIAALEDVNKNLRSDMAREAAERRKSEETKNVKINELNMLIQEREKEAALRFAELSEKKGLLESELRNEKLKHAQDIEEGAGRSEELKKELNSRRLEYEMRFNALLAEKAEAERTFSLRAQDMQSVLEESANQLRIQGEEFAEKLREKEVHLQAKEKDWQQAISEKETALFRLQDEMQRKMAEKDDAYAAESDRLRAAIMQNAQKFQDEKDLLAEKLKALESNLASAGNTHKKELEGLNALRASERDALNSRSAELGEKLSLLSLDLEKSRASGSELAALNAKLAANLASEKEDKRNIAQSLGERLLEKENEIRDRDRQIECFKAEFAEMIKSKDGEISGLAERINRLSAEKSESEEKLSHSRDKLISENKALHEEFNSLRSSSREELAEANNKADVRMIEKAAEIDKLKQTAAALKSELVRRRAEQSSAQDNLKKHYLDLLAEKDKAFASAAETYDKKFEELTASGRKKDLAIKKREDAFLQREEGFKKELALAALSAQREKEALASQMNGRIIELGREVQLLREEIRSTESEANSEKNALERRIGELNEKITSLRVGRENDAARAKEQTAELANQLKIRDMKLKDEMKRKQDAVRALEEENSELKAELRRQASEHGKSFAKREEGHGKEISLLRAELNGLRDELKADRKKSSLEKQIISDNFDERLRQAENNFNGDKIKLNNEIRELADINRALEEELSSIRLRLESFKSGMQ